jgi:hypothetical protein
LALVNKKTGVKNFFCHQYRMQAEFKQFHNRLLLAKKRCSFKLLKNAKLYYGWSYCSVLSSTFPFQFAKIREILATQKFQSNLSRVAAVEIFKTLELAYHHLLLRKETGCETANKKLC